MADTGPAAELREAATAMRKRAEEATPGPWERPLDTQTRSIVGAALPADEKGRYQDGVVPTYMTRGYLSRYIGQRERVCVVACETWSDGHFSRKRSGRDLDYIASMHPLVALALADWLDRFSDSIYCYGPAEFDHVLAIARAYLGSTDAD
jgi:hypothetical protein